MINSYLTWNNFQVFVKEILELVFCSPVSLKAEHSYYRKTSNISRTLVGIKIVHNSDVVGASPVGTTPTTSSFST